MKQFVVDFEWSITDVTERALLFVYDSLSQEKSPILSVPVMKSELKSMVLDPGVELREATVKPWLMFKDHRRVGV